MTLKVIGAGLGRTGTLSLKLALEHIGLGKCYHMSEMLANVRSHLPLWLDSMKGNPHWHAVFDGYQSSTDYPGCMVWRELAATYPDAKIILTTRDPDKWFDSVSETVMSPQHRARLEGNPAMAEFFRLTVFAGDLEQRLGNRQKMVEYFNAWNQAVIDEVPADKLLVYGAGDGWEPLCEFLGVPVPPEPYPRVNSREEMTERTEQALDSNASRIDRDGPPPPEVLEGMVRGYLDAMKEKAFPPRA